jgi:hypothetical protein
VPCDCLRCEEPLPLRSPFGRGDLGELWSGGVEERDGRAVGGRHPTAASQDAGRQLCDEDGGDRQHADDGDPGTHRRT